MPRKFRYQVRPTAHNAAGKRALGYGVRVGYWPCLRAPYFQIAFHKWRLDVWHGHSSYR